MLHVIKALSDIWMSEKEVESFCSSPCGTYDRQKDTVYERFQALTAASMMFRIVFWDVLRVK
jgi:hypothetical protein